MTNNTESIIDVRLFPKDEFRKGDLYKAGDFGGGYIESSFQLLPSENQYWLNQEVLFYTKDTSALPSTIIGNVFDSIKLIINDSLNTHVMFKPEGVDNYLVNPFTNDSLWLFEIVDSERPDNFCENPVRIKAYTFSIQEDLVIHN
jgi:hypothetical protein